MGGERMTRGERGQYVSVIAARKNTAEIVKCRLMDNAAAWVYYYGPARGSSLVEDFCFLLDEVTRLQGERDALASKLSDAKYKLEAHGIKDEEDEA